MLIARSISSPFDITLIEWLQWHLWQVMSDSKDFSSTVFLAKKTHVNQLISIVVVDGSCQEYAFKRGLFFFNVGSSNQQLPLPLAGQLQRAGPRSQIQEAQSTR